MSNSLAALINEIASIHSANCCYWKVGKEAAFKARAAYQLRLDRLQDIRSELALLEGPFAAIPFRKILQRSSRLEKQKRGRGPVNLKT